MCVCVCFLPVGPKSGTRHVPTANRNGQLPSSPGPSSTATEISKESSPPALPIRKCSSPASLGNEVADNKEVPETGKAVVPPPVMARKNTAPAIMMDSEVVNTSSVPAVVEVEEDDNDDDEPPPPLPVKKSSSDLTSDVVASTKETNEVVLDQSTTKDVVSTSQLTSPEGTPPPPLPTKMAEEVNITEGLDGEQQSEDNDEGSPPPLPVKVAEVPPPPPPEEDDSDESPPPLPVKKELSLALTDVPPPEPPGDQVAAPEVVPPPEPPGDQVAAPEEDDNEDDDEPPPPLPVKKSAQPEAPLPSTVVPVVSPPVEAPVNLLSVNNIDAGPDLGGSRLAPELAGSKDTNVPPPVPHRRTPVLQSQPNSVDSNKGDSVANPPPLPNKVITAPPPPPPDTSSDSESEDDKRPQRPSLVTLKSQSVQDDDIALSVPKKYSDETSDSSDDEECSLGMKIISQPSVDGDTIAISSTPICDPQEDVMNMGQPLLNNCTSDDSVMKPGNTTKIPPPPVKPRPLSKRVPSPPLLSPPHNSLSKSASCDALSDISSVYSELGPAPASMYSELGPAPATVYSQLGPAPSSMYSQVGPAPNSMYSQVGPAPSTLPAQVGNKCV